jgi:hypothetical protein
MTKSLTFIFIIKTFLHGLLGESKPLLAESKPLKDATLSEVIYI